MNKVAAKMSAEPNLGSVVKEVARIVSSLTGIQLGDKQFAMVENRLRTRMLRLDIASGSDYLHYLNDHLEEESQALVSLMTTHHTYFFREFAHFEYLQNKGLPAAISNAKKRGDNKIRVWSAACSRGQEVYSLAMFLEHHLQKLAPGMDYEIWGTDVDPESVKIAQNGVYPYKDLKSTPAIYLGNLWSRGTGDISDYAKIKQSVRAKCKFDVFNLNAPAHLPANKKFDIIFCRNVFIYFNEKQIELASKYLLSRLQAGGFFFIGISETLNGLNLTAKTVGPSIYSNPLTVIDEDKQADQKQVSAVKHPVTAPQEAPLLKVLCVDDSPSILAIMKNILSKKDGFEVVATASNGREAMDMIHRHKFDVVTLDIHMPEMDGLEYLQKSMSSSHPPVVMVSSVNRENANVALKAIELGAFDYVEKPTMANLLERGDEIRAKLKSAFYSRGSIVKMDSIDKSFKKDFKITLPEQKLRLIFISLAEKRKISYLLKNLSKQDPLTVFIFEGTEEAISPVVEKIKVEVNVPIQLDLGNSGPGQVVFTDFKSAEKWMSEQIKVKKTSVMVGGIPSQKVTDFLSRQTQLHLFLEDLGPNAQTAQKGLIEIATARMPVTSYLSVSEEYLG